MSQRFQQPWYSEQNESPSTINFEEEPSLHVQADRSMASIQRGKYLQQLYVENN